MNDRVTVQSYNALINRLMYETVSTLRNMPGRLTRAANVILNRGPETSGQQLYRAIYIVRRNQIRLANEIRFVDSAFFEQLCVNLDIVPEEAYRALQDKYAPRCKRALSLAVKAEREYVDYVANK